VPKAQTTNPFHRTREDHAREVIEDYLELIFRMGQESPLEEPVACGGTYRVKTADLVRTLQVSQPTVTQTLLRLEADGLVCVHPRQFVHLTERGTVIAMQSLHRHQMVVNFLKTIGVSEIQADVDAEGIEHHVSTETLMAMQRFMETRH
jgi:DtxR family transcriptional regulator, manganese transport regulator